MGDWPADGFGNAGREGEGSALGAGGAQAALFAGEGEQEFVFAVGTAPTGEPGAEIAAAQKSLDGLVEVVVVNGLSAAEVAPMVVQDLPDRGGVRVAGAVTGGGGHGTDRKARSTV